MENKELNFLIEKCGITKERAIEILNAFKEMYKFAQNSGYKIS